MWQRLKQAVVRDWWEALDLNGTMEMEKTEGEFFFKWEMDSSSSSFYTLFGSSLSLTHHSVENIVN